jgi:hypothetical protein
MISIECQSAGQAGAGSGRNYGFWRKDATDGEYIHRALMLWSSSSKTPVLLTSYNSSKELFLDARPSLLL